MIPRIPARFERVAAAFNVDVARVRLCESSGSEHSPGNTTDLSDMVKSFMEKNDREVEEGAKCMHDKEEEENIDEDSEMKAMLRSLLIGCSTDHDRVSEDGSDWNVKGHMKDEVELAYASIGESWLPSFKRRLMARLRDRGLDAGLCKSKWEKIGGFPSGNYEYVDVNFAGKRYIVEVSLEREFEIARPSNQFSSLLDVFPSIYVGEVEELKKIVRLMCSAIKQSMKSLHMHVPPWRRNGYMQAKWFSSYKRTTNEVATKEALGLATEARSTKKYLGFHAPSVKSYHNCRGDYGTKVGFRVAHLSAALNTDGTEMMF